ncbi:DUF1840 domain-containing protein [Legionella worsleiensis]|uniref:DUF1840 domain-containing protein n=1 Tax=Legionella worsleiensis TaxID=45076 RepID=A0A0W1AFU1_9GAMM|nr:DUF1840 domain-containing protein [Legionella worsleiensis]KTD80209.1 hypothetical protein Lwor_1117 [Legionella worsleiensis]STY31731.1 Domain of uncharacterised function (DUF1840) [Legionella worsleiensis]
MFITFRCDAYEDITYFNDVAKRLLTLMGHSGTVPGALTSGEVSEALRNLQQGLGIEQSKSNSRRQDDDEDHEPEIGLAKRAVPLLSLLKAAEKNNVAVLWGAAKSPHL